MPVTTRRQQAAVGAGTQQPASQARHDDSRRHTKEADEAAKQHQFIEDIIGTGAKGQRHACMVHGPHLYTACA